MYYLQCSEKEQLVHQLCIVGYLAQMCQSTNGDKALLYAVLCSVCNVQHLDASEML